jgi:hypothetical protein
MSDFNTILNIVNTNIYQYLRVQDGKNLQYTCKDIAQLIDEIRNKPAFKSDPTGCAPFNQDIYTWNEYTDEVYLFGERIIDIPRGNLEYYGMNSPNSRRWYEQNGIPFVLKYEVISRTSFYVEDEGMDYHDDQIAIVDTESDAKEIIDIIWQGRYKEMRNKNDMSLYPSRYPKYDY